MIGPWKVTINHFEYQFFFTCIDSVVCLPETTHVYSATSRTVTQAVEDS